MNEGVKVVAVLLVLSFAIERLATGLLFALSFLRQWTKLFPDPALLDPPSKVAVQKRLVLVHFTFTAAMAIAGLWMFPSVRVLGILGLQPDAELDALLTGLVLVPGADRIADALKGQAAGLPRPEPPPIKVTGTLTLEQAGASPDPGSRRAGVS